jgi:hypothetical protein
MRAVLLTVVGGVEFKGSRVECSRKNATLACAAIPALPDRFPIVSPVDVSAVVPVNVVVAL